MITPPRVVRPLRFLFWRRLLWFCDHHGWKRLGGFLSRRVEATLAPRQKTKP